MIWYFVIVILEMNKKKDIKFDVFFVYKLSVVYLKKTDF